MTRAKIARGRVGLRPHRALVWVLALAPAACAHGPVAALESSGLAARATAQPSAAEAAAVRAAILASRAQAMQLSLTARTTRFSSDGRVRATLQLLLARPDRMRLTVLSPHGPPLWAMACDGNQITALDVGAQAYSQQPATPLGLAHYLAGFDLDMDAAAWVALFMGEMDIPAHATLSRDKEGAKAIWTWQWAVGPQQTQAIYDASTAQLLRASVLLGDGREGTLKVQNRDGATHLPQSLALHVGPGSQKRGREPAVDVEILLGDVQLLPQPPADTVFVIAAPGVPIL